MASQKEINQGVYERVANNLSDKMKGLLLVLEGNVKMVLPQLRQMYAKYSIMHLYCSSQPTVGYHCFRYEFHGIFLVFPLPSFFSSGQQLCLPIRTDDFQLCLASNPTYYPRTYSSTPSDLISYYYCLPVFIYWLILLLLQFSFLVSFCT